MILLFAALILGAVSGQNPCEPDVCGENAYCVPRGASLIACVCLDGYKGSGFDGCYKDRQTFLEDLNPEDYFQDEDVNHDGGNLVKKQIGEGEGILEDAVDGDGLFRDDVSSVTPGSRFSSQNGRPTIVPAVLSRGNDRDRKPVVFGFDSSGSEVVGDIGDGVDPEIGDARPVSPSLPTPVRASENLRPVSPPLPTPVRGGVSASAGITLNDRTSPSQSETRGDGGSEFRVIQTNPRFYKNPFKRPDGSLAGGREGAVDLDKLFPEECLINEDCPDTDYCDPNTRSCTDACNLDVCGGAALCRSALNRPVCYCPDGFEGNPYDECKKSPSRVGMRFKRGLISLP